MGLKTVRVLTQTARVPSNTVRVPANTVRVPSKTARVPTKTVRVPTKAVRVPANTVFPDCQGSLKDFQCSSVPGSADIVRFPTQTGSICARSATLLLTFGSVIRIMRASYTVATHIRIISA
jgi:hypothetical protein